MWHLHKMVLLPWGAHSTEMKGVWASTPAHSSLPLSSQNPPSPGDTEGPILVGS